MERTFKMTRAIDKREQPWMDGDCVVEQGAIVYEYLGHDYGCIGPKGIAVSYVRGETPFFEVPANAVEPLNN